MPIRQIDNLTTRPTDFFGQIGKMGDPSTRRSFPQTAGVQTKRTCGGIALTPFLPWRFPCGSIGQQGCQFELDEKAALWGLIAPRGLFSSWTKQATDKK
jgi:hypothetical protein